MTLPVYVFTGFLESGKTMFIKDTLKDPGFTNNEVTLLISCEEGEEEYDKDFLQKTHSKLLQLEDKDEFTAELLSKAAAKVKPDRVVIEYNGMWDMRLINQAFPKDWELYQVITTINAETYKLYLANMGSQIYQQVSNSELIVFNRCTDELKDYIHSTSIRAMNPQAYIYLEDNDGNAEDFADNEPLPYDIDAPIVDIKPEDYGRFYVDAMNDPEKYDGKTIKVYVQLHKRGDTDPPERFAAGRFSMVCCANDITFLALFCDMENGQEIVEERSYANITAEVKNEYVKEFHGNMPVLKVLKFEPADAPEDDLLYMNGGNGGNF